ncbi:MAG: DUF3866 family protein [Coriobacteriales bacterium]|jgi:hypothetical protein|nr:DUF3866 family protein [Coriobacteriales bacterium]
MSLRWATVLEVLDTRDDLQIVQVRLAGAADAAESVASADTPNLPNIPNIPNIPDAARKLRACNYLALGPRVAIGQRVLVNTTGIDLQLGTGGVVFILPGEASPDSISANEASPDPSSLSADPSSALRQELSASLDASSAPPDTTAYGHIVKLRYTPLQTAVDSVEEQDSPFHALLQNAESLAGMPVVCCELHSQMPLVAAAIKHAAPEATVAYLMNDAAALPLAFSDLLPRCVEAGLIDRTISSGQAFGGQFEAINLYSGLLTAHVVAKADVVIVAPGPGVVGSGTALGHSGTAQGEALNATAALGGTPLAVLRLSWQDRRERHRGLSHHTRTVLGRVCLCEVWLPLPGNLSASQTREVMQQMEESGILAKHALVPVFAELDAIDLRGVEVTTMGRGRSDDPAFFSAAFAAGIQAAAELKTP